MKQPAPASVLSWGVYGYLTAMAELIGGEDGEELLVLRDRLSPDGLSSQQKTYRGQAGQATQLEDRLTPEVLAKTDAFIVGQGPTAKPLTAYLKEWIAIGKQFGALEDEKGAFCIWCGGVGGCLCYEDRAITG